MVFSGLLFLKIFWTGISGALGTGTRHFVSTISYRHIRGHIPWGTFFINISGSFIIGFLSAVFVRHPALSSWHGSLVLGFLGGYTTFSTFMLEITRLRSKGAHVSLWSYVLMSMLVGPSAVFLGILLGRWI